MICGETRRENAHDLDVPRMHRLLWNVCIGRSGSSPRASINEYLAHIEGCNMKAADKREVVMWAARAYVGEYLDESDELRLLAGRTGSREYRAHDALPLDDASKCLVCLLADLRALSRVYFPIDPAAEPERLMTVFVERIARSEDARGEPVARLDIVFETNVASAGVLLKGAPRQDVGPVPCAQQDRVWEIVLNLLSAMYARN